MNRTDRLLAIMLHLQSRRYTRGEDLAARLSLITVSFQVDSGPDHVVFPD